MTHLFRWRRRGGVVEAHFPLTGTVDHLEFHAPHPYPPGHLHLFEHLLLRASQPALQAAEARGCTYNASTTDEAVSFYLSSPDDRPAVALDALPSAPFTASDLEHERATIAQERMFRQGPTGPLDAMLGSAADTWERTLVCA